MRAGFLTRLFFRPNWRLAVRELAQPDASPLLRPGLGAEYRSLAVPLDGWCADPFLCEEGGRIYVFCEFFGNACDRGAIAAAELSGGKLKDMRIILSQGCHMSYPCVFKSHGEFYMVPETSESGRVDLYRAVRFPYEWQPAATLQDGVRCVDLTVFEDCGQLYAIGCTLGRPRNRICAFQLDLDAMAMRQIAEYGDDGTGRPAGNVFNWNGRLFRPSQNSIRKYGESLVLQELSLESGIFHEEPRFTLKSKDIRVNGEKRIDRIHTINRSGNTEIIDYSRDTFDPLRPLWLIRSRLTGKPRRHSHANHTNRQLTGRIQ